MYVCMYVCVCVCVCMYVCMYVCMHACMHACMYVCMYVCMYMYVCICTYWYVHMYVAMYVIDIASNTSLTCLVVWIMAAPLTHHVHGHADRARDPLHLSCKLTWIHHAYLSYNARDGACTWTNCKYSGLC